MEMKKHLERVFQIISAMPVTGDNQDLAVAAKNELRAALEEFEQQKAKAEQRHEFDPKKQEVESNG